MSEYTPEEIPHHSRAGEFLKSLSSQALQDFKSIESLSLVCANSYLFMEDQKPSEIFVLLRGQVKLTISSDEGKRFILRVANPGDFLGLTSAFTGIRHTTTAETLYPCVIAALRRTDFLEFLGRHPVAYPSVLRALSMDCNQAHQRLRTIGLASSARARFARLLLEWCAEGRKTERGICFRLTLTHAEIAEFIGVARETVTRTLAEFKQCHIVEMRGSRMTISNRSALEDYAYCGPERRREDRFPRDTMCGSLPISL